MDESLFFFFLVWAIFNVFIEVCYLLLLSYVLFFFLAERYGGPWLPTVLSRLVVSNSL